MYVELSDFSNCFAGLSFVLSDISKFGLKIYRIGKLLENYWILYHEANKEASTVLCSVVKHFGSGAAFKK